MRKNIGLKGSGPSSAPRGTVPGGKCGSRVASNPVFELVQRETGLWAILHRTGRKASVVETGQVDRQIAALDLASYASSRSLSPIGQGWLKVADRLASNMKTRRYQMPGHEHEILTRADVLRLLLKQGYQCAVSGSYFTHDSFDGDKRDPFQPSIDRRDSSLGYAASNIRIVCYLVNLAMNEWGEAPLRKIAERISRPVLRPDSAPSAIVARRRIVLTSCEYGEISERSTLPCDNDQVSHSLARRVSCDTVSLDIQEKTERV